jgi:hypothetical protein
MLILNPNWEIFTALKNAVLALIISFNVLVRTRPASYYPGCKSNRCGIKDTSYHILQMQISSTVKISWALDCEVYRSVSSLSWMAS